MAKLTPPARYDLPWKAALTHALQAFMAFFFEELSIQIDWSRRPRFRDKELATITLGDTAGCQGCRFTLKCRRSTTHPWPGAFSFTPIVFSGGAGAASRSSRGTIRNGCSRPNGI
jgi:hypothetical protein